MLAETAPMALRSLRFWGLSKTEPGSRHFGNSERQCELGAHGSCYSLTFGFNQTTVRCIGNTLKWMFSHVIVIFMLTALCEKIASRNRKVLETNNRRLAYSEKSVEITSAKLGSPKSLCVAIVTPRLWRFLSCLGDGVCWRSEPIHDHKKSVLW